MPVCREGGSTARPLGVGAAVPQGPGDPTRALCRHLAASTVLVLPLPLSAAGAGLARPAKSRALLTARVDVRDPGRGNSMSVDAQVSERRVSAGGWPDRPASRRKRHSQAVGRRHRHRTEIPALCGRRSVASGSSTCMCGCLSLLGARRRGLVPSSSMSRPMRAGCRGLVPDSVPSAEGCRRRVKTDPWALLGFEHRGVSFHPGLTRAELRGPGTPVGRETVSLGSQVVRVVLVVLVVLVVRVRGWCRVGQ